MHSKQPVLAELQYFVSAVSSIRSQPSEISPQLVRCSLNLLEDLPTAREAVLEYFALVFDISVANYKIVIEKDANITPQEDESIADIQEALENLVTDGPHAWAPLISGWSLRLLGQLSDKHSRRRPLDIGSACNLWLGSQAMRGLLGLAALCFGKLNGEETETCVTVMLSTFVQSTPYFDWVVARLGGCFPLKVISKILQCGLKGFLSNFNSTLDSEVGILGYLSYAHEADLKHALKEMLEAVLHPNKHTLVNPNTIPYLLHLSGMSEVLLQPIIGIFIELFDESMIESLAIQSQLWPPNYNMRDAFPQLTKLVMKVSNNATKIVLLLAKIADRYTWCHEMLENLLLELEYFTLDERKCTLLTDITKDDSKKLLWQACRNENPIVHQTAVRLILIVSCQCHSFYHQTIVDLLLSSAEYGGDIALGCLVRILGALKGTANVSQATGGIEMALERTAIAGRRSRDESSDSTKILINLVKIIKIEKESKSPHLTTTPLSRACKAAVSKILDIFSALLNKRTSSILNWISNEPSDNEPLQEVQIKRIKLEPGAESGTEAADEMQIITSEMHSVAKILDLLEIGQKGSNLAIAEVIKLTQATVKYFFVNAAEPNRTLRTVAINRAFTMLGRQCVGGKAARTAALRDLLEGALFLYGNLFGGEIDSDEDDFALKKDEMLIGLNQRLGVTINTNRTVLHAGVIGQGPKAPPKSAVRPDREVQNLLINALLVCCQAPEWHDTLDGFSTVSLLLVEMVSPDVMYNGLPWPEEDFTRVTMERDLQIRRQFKTTPILWSILSLVAVHRPSLCYASVLARAICAAVLHQWRARSVERMPSTSEQSQRSELMSVTIKLLEVLALGQLLPPPLSYLHCVIENFDALEIAFVLRECVWNYMRENIPSPMLFTMNELNGFHWRDPTKSIADAQFIDPLRLLMQKKLPQLGVFYNQMFVLPSDSV